MRDKLYLIFIPYILTLIGLVAGYTFIHWLFFIKFDLFSLKEVITIFAIPIILAGIAVLFFLRPRFKILNLNKKNSSDNYRDFYCFALWIILIIPLIIAQEYMVVTTGKLTELTKISEINNQESTKYYTIKDNQLHVNKDFIGVHTEFDVTGKHSENFIMIIYVAMPVFDNTIDVLTDEPLAWMGMKYSKKISNRLEPSKKETEYRKFAEDSQNNFYYKDVKDFVYLERVGNSDDRDGYLKAIGNNPKYKSSETVFVGVNTPFDARVGKKQEWFLASVLIGSLVWLIMLVIPKIDKRELNRIKAGKPDKKAQRERQEMISLITPRHGFFVTPILIYVNIAIFIAMVVAGLGFIFIKGSDLLGWGANYGPSVKNGEWWRLLSSIFLHGGIMHVLVNMVGLFYVGVFLEPLLGWKRYLSFYLLTGILASIASVWWYDATISVGASGSIFGLFGIFFAFLLTKIYPPDFTKPFLISTSVFIGFNLLMGLAGGIDNAAHIGGLLSGFILGIILYPTIKRQIEGEETK
jgi:Uncharacterized membrane protein (homolog of Drosophila rhomboid)